MLKRTILIFTAAAIFWGTIATQTARARDYYDDDDDIWDMMDPSWWADEIFGNDDDDDWWYYRHHRFSPYWGSPYGGYPPVFVIQQQPEPQTPEIEPPE